MKCMECTKKKAQHCICASVNFAISAFIPVMHWSAQLHNCASAQLHGQGRQGMQLSLQTKSFHHRIWSWHRKGDDKDFFSRFWNISTIEHIAMHERGFYARCKMSDGFCYLSFSCFLDAVFNLSFLFSKMQFLCKRPADALLQLKYCALSRCKSCW